VTFIDKVSGWKKRGGKGKGSASESFEAFQGKLRALRRSERRSAFPTYRSSKWLARSAKRKGGEEGEIESLSTYTRNV